MDARSDFSPAARAVCRGILLRLQNRRPQALAEFETAARLGPMPEARQWLAISLLESGNASGAEIQRLEAIRLSPSDENFKSLWDRVQDRVRETAARPAAGS